MAREAISKKLRFEVFKRDSFKCQYCGKASPEVVLHVDHIKPVKEGGKNHITNLITSCIDCNLGKGARTLDDNSVMEKQKKQLDDLNERREQLKMMMEWREELNHLEDDQIDYIDNRISELSGYGLSDYGRNEMRKTIKKYDYSLILESLEKSATQYLKKDKTDKITSESASKFIDYIPKICNGTLISQQHPEYKEINYIKGIMRNRFNYFDASKANQIIRSGFDSGVNLNKIADAAKTAKNWTEFRELIQDLVDKVGD